MACIPRSHSDRCSTPSWFISMRSNWSCATRLDATFLHTESSIHASILKVHICDVDNPWFYSFTVKFTWIHPVPLAPQFVVQFSGFGHEAAGKQCPCHCASSLSCTAAQPVCQFLSIAPSVPPLGSDSFDPEAASLSPFDHFKEFDNTCAHGMMFGTCTQCFMLWTTFWSRGWVQVCSCHVCEWTTQQILWRMRHCF